MHLRGTVDRSDLIVHFSEVKLEKGRFERDKEYRWFLYRSSNSKGEYHTNNFTSIYRNEATLFETIQNHITSTNP